MVSTSRIHVGCRVQGCFGPLVANPNGNTKRRVREKVLGTVIRAVDQHKWEVVFDYDGVSRQCKSNALLVVPNDSGIPLHETAAAPAPAPAAAASVHAPASSDDDASRSMVANALLMVSTSEFVDCCLFHYF